MSNYGLSLFELKERKLPRQFGQWLIKGVKQVGLTSYADFFLGEVGSSLSLSRLPARVLSVQNETKDARTLVLKPSYSIGSFVAGQYISVEVEVNGVRLKRNYSFSSSPEQYRQEGTFSITVKRQQGGRVSNALHDEVRIGDILHLGAVSGDFSLHSYERRTVLIAGGSGITPFMSMLEDVASHRSSQPLDIHLFYFARTASDFIFSDRLVQMAALIPGFSYTSIVTDNGDTDDNGHLCLAHIDPQNLGFSNSQALLCGPLGFMDSAAAILKEAGINEELLYRESFGLGNSYPSKERLAVVSGSVTFSKSGHRVETDGKSSILDVAESLGLSPKFGCRSGVCHECKCQKTSGQVMNMMSGQLGSPDDTVVQTCISVPFGDVVIDI